MERSLNERTATPTTIAHEALTVYGSIPCMNRRRLLAAIGGSVVALAGCTDDGQIDDQPNASPTAGTRTDSPTTADRGTPTDSELPASCPTTEGLDVSWPTELDAATAESFVEAYEAVYYRDVVVEYEPESQVDSYELAGSVSDVASTGDGWTLTYSGGGGIYRPTLWLSAQPTTPPDSATVISSADVEDDLLADLLSTAADSGEAEQMIEPPGARVDRYIDRLTTLSPDFDGLSGPGDSDSLYVAVDGTAIELTAQATNFHGDYGWWARYYVTDRVVWRISGDEGDPRDGQLLECRETE